mmetsp:Transcript_28930/g.43474  ORF Transcript_28930/g.43474 Transcript_28930/m.43474 type:complete len:89 (+) Transcript_28930:550-816(+)
MSSFPRALPSQSWFISKKRRQSKKTEAMMVKFISFRLLQIVSSSKNSLRFEDVPKSEIKQQLDEMCVELLYSGVEQSTFESAIPSSSL